MLTVIEDNPPTCILDLKIVPDSIMKLSTIMSMYKVLLFVFICLYLFVIFFVLQHWFYVSHSVSHNEYSNKYVLV